MRLGGWVGGLSLGALLLCIIVVSTVMGRVCMAAKPDGRQKLPSSVFFHGLPSVLNIAHRGASKRAVEHTAEAYEMALREGADVLELDLRATRDGVLLVTHDARLDRTLGLDATVSEHSYAELSSMAGARMPLRLGEVFSRFAGVHLNLEIKDEEPSVARALGAQITAAGAEARVLVASSHDAVLAEFRRAAPAVATSASFREALTFYACYRLGKGCAGRYVALQIPALRWLGLTSRDFIGHAHAAGLVVHFWTVDSEADQRALVAAGADGIMTNLPDRLGRVLRNVPRMLR
jgi:glycerophosphoryl diester phosphodiesterase